MTKFQMLTDFLTQQNTQFEMSNDPQHRTITFVDKNNKDDIWILKLVRTQNYMLYHNNYFHCRLTCEQHELLNQITNYKEKIDNDNEIRQAHDALCQYGIKQGDLPKGFRVTNNVGGLSKGMLTLTNDCATLTLESTIDPPILKLWKKTSTGIEWLQDFPLNDPQCDNLIIEYLNSHF